jgi:hypothetical protein
VLKVAPEDSLISILSLAPLVEAKELRHLRWQGFVVLKSSLLATVLQNNRSLTTLELEAHYRGWRLQNDHLRVLAESRVALSCLGMQFGQFSISEFSPAIRLLGSTLSTLNLSGSIIAGGNVASLIVQNCPNLKSFFAPSDFVMRDLEACLMGLCHLTRMGSEMFGGDRFLSVSNLNIRATSEDLEMVTFLEQFEADYLWDAVLATMRCEKDREVVAAGLYLRLATLTSVLRLIPTLTVGMLEWILLQRSETARYFKMDDLTMVPVFAIPVQENNS